MDAFADQLFDDERNYHSPTLPHSIGHHLNPFGLDQIVPSQYAQSHPHYAPVDPRFVPADPYHKGPVQLVPVNPPLAYAPQRPQYGPAVQYPKPVPLLPYGPQPIASYGTQPLAPYGPQAIKIFPGQPAYPPPAFKPLPGSHGYSYPSLYQPQAPPGHPRFPFLDAGPNGQPDSYHPQQQVPNFQSLPDDPLPSTSEARTAKAVTSAFNDQPINVVEARQELKSVLDSSKPAEAQDQSSAIDRLRFINGQYPPSSSNANFRSKRSLFGYFRGEPEEEEEEFLPTVISHEDRWVAGCLMQCVYRKNNAVDENGFPTLEGLTDLYTAGIKEQPMFVHVLRATVRCLRTSGAKHGIYSKKLDHSTRNGLTCDVSFDVFDCIADSITDYCTS